MQRGYMDTGEGRFHIHPVVLNGKGIFRGRESGGGSVLLGGWLALAAALDRDESTRELILIRGRAGRRCGGDRIPWRA